MKAVVLRTPKNLQLEDVPKPRLSGEDQVLVRVEACGICGSDLRYWAGENPWALHTLGRHVDNPPNIILGHEYAGVVAEVNAARYEHLLGKRVGVQAYRVCGSCELCRGGHPNLCKQTIHIGHAQGWGQMDFYPGAYAEYCLGWADLLYPIPEDVSFAEAAMSDLFNVAVHAAGRATLRPGCDVLCIGGGPIGLSVAQVAKARGARRVFISETSPLARGVLAHYDFRVIDPARESLRHALAGTVAAVFDTVGTGEIAAEALPLLEECGTYVNLAVHSSAWSFNAMLLASERTITTSSNATYEDVREAYELIYSRRVNVSPMITHCFNLSGHKQAFELLLSDPKQAYKVVFTPNG